VKTGGIEMLEILKTKARIILGKQKAMGVIEVVLIILGILTPYYGVSIKCIT
jgi:hypothetical protein